MRPSMTKKGRLSLMLQMTQQYSTARILSLITSALVMTAVEKGENLSQSTAVGPQISLRFYFLTCNSENTDSHSFSFSILFRG